MAGASSGGARTPLPAPLGPDAASRPPRLAPPPPPLADRVLSSLRGACPEVATGDGARVEAARDWWPLSAAWALDGVAPALPAAVARPTDARQVAAVLRICGEAGVAVTPFAGASGVCGGSIPVSGGLSLDLTGLSGIVDVDDTSLLVEVRAGTFGDLFEQQLRNGPGLTLGHWPQSISLSTVGGWVACRGAGQYSTRYGKIEDMVTGLEVATSDGQLLRTGGRAPRSATGPDLTQLFVGCEGTLGVITGVRLRVRPLPAVERMAAYGFPDFAGGLDACRLILRRGATPAVLRLYDHAESARQFDLTGTAALVVVDEGDPALVEATMAVVAEECRDGRPLDPQLAARWLERRNHIPPVEALVRAGLVVDTIEVAASWSGLPGLYDRAVRALTALEGTVAASAHQSHSYSDGACLYFTFAGQPPGGDRAAAERYYRRAFDAVTAAASLSGGTISHHHGIGLNRARYMATELGPAMHLLQSVKDALDPAGILNPGKLGLRPPPGATFPVP